jgi:DNA-binding NarL/FixJ family response regulator
MIGHSKTALIIDGDEFFSLAVGKILTRDLGFGKILELPAQSMAITTMNDFLPVGLLIVEASLLSPDYTFIHSLRRHNPDTRVVVVSASQDRELALQSLSIGAHGHIFKGGSVSEMRHALRMVLDGILWVPSFVANLGRTDALGSALNPVVRMPTANLQALTARQREVLQFVVRGKSNKEIARLMQLREGTIKVHMAGLFRNLGTVNRSSAAVLGERLFSAQEAQKDSQESRVLALSSKLGADGPCEAFVEGDGEPNLNLHRYRKPDRRQPFGTVLKTVGL